jgi:hypothetical protein
MLLLLDLHGFDFHFELAVNDSLLLGIVGVEKLLLTVVKLLTLGSWFYCTQHILWKVVRDRPDPALTSIPETTLAHQAHSLV